MKQGDIKHNVNCIVVGDGMVGKSTLALSFTQQKFPDDYVATVFENYAGLVSVAGEQFTVKIFDSPGQHDYEGVREFSYKDSEVYILCYSVGDRDSFKNIKEFWAPEAKSHMKRKRPTILVGCQSDLREHHEYYDSDIISAQEGEALARDIGADCFLECSSLEGYNTRDVFETSVMSVLKYRKKKSNIFNRLLRR